jgi:hypothetical protein
MKQQHQKEQRRRYERLVKMEKPHDKNTDDDENPTSNIRTPSSSSSSAPPVRIPFYAWKVLAILSCIATMVMYAETMLIPAIPDLIADFHVSYSKSSWILTASCSRSGYDSNCWQII